MSRAPRLSRLPSTLVHKIMWMSSDAFQKVTNIIQLLELTIEQESRLSEDHVRLLASIWVPWLKQRHTPILEDLRPRLALLVREYIFLEERCKFVDSCIKGRCASFTRFRTISIASHKSQKIITVSNSLSVFHLKISIGEELCSKLSIDGEDIECDCQVLDGMLRLDFLERPEIWFLIDMSKLQDFFCDSYISINISNAISETKYE
jgi:hypothetical protein